MPKDPRLNANDAEKLLLENGFSFIRSKGSHLIFIKGDKRKVIPIQGTKVLHPKIVKQVLKAIQ